MNITQKDLDKNRRGFIRYLYTLKSRWNEDMYCLYCAKAQTLYFCTNEHGICGAGVYGDMPAEVKEQLGFTLDQYSEMERRFEGWSERLDEYGQLPDVADSYKLHDFKDIAKWCQTLPDWPTVI